MLENLLEEGSTIKQISEIICVAERTIYRRMNEYSLGKISFTNDNDADLDKNVHEIFVEFPNC